MKRRMMGSVSLLAILAGAMQIVPTALPPAGKAGFHVDAPPDVSAALERSCGDCHSGATRLPWYGRIAPASWLVAHHVREGRSELDFSTWDRLPASWRAEIRRDICRETKGGSMPLRSYLWLHPGARLAPAEIAAICRWSSVDEEPIDAGAE
ncbi:MAG TPA: heme-binding domain-containing protein [Thermoanaerobaculia bacterium]|nr:heme-binding domain-containing protein [Thermoanaerobaculia bacterium]